jgi:hypothetical protein
LGSQVVEVEDGQLRSEWRFWKEKVPSSKYICGTWLIWKANSNKVGLNMATWWLLVGKWQRIACSHSLGSVSTLRKWIIIFFKKRVHILILKLYIFPSSTMILCYAKNYSVM